MIGDSENPRISELTKLIESKWSGFTVTCTQLFDEQAVRVHLERTPQDAREFIVSDEVIQDYSPKQIINGLEANNWMILLGECRKRGITARFTNSGWAHCRCLSENHSHPVPCLAPEATASDHLCKECSERAAKEAWEANQQHQSQEIPPLHPTPNLDLYKPTQ